MKLFIVIFFEHADFKEMKAYKGFVRGAVRKDGRTVISPSKIYRAAFGGEMPAYTLITVQ